MTATDVACRAWNLSRSKARVLIYQGGFYINAHRIKDPNREIELSDFIDGQIMVLRKGKKDYFLMKLTEET